MSDFDNIPFTINSITCYLNRRNKIKNYIINFHINYQHWKVFYFPRYSIVEALRHKNDLSFPIIVLYSLLQTQASLS